MRPISRDGRWHFAPPRTALRWRRRTTGRGSWATRASRPAASSCATCCRLNRSCFYTSRSQLPSHTNPCSRTALSGSHPRGFLQAQRSNRDFTHLEFLDLPGDGHRERVHELPVTRNLVARDLAFAPCLEIVAGGSGALAQLHP